MSDFLVDTIIKNDWMVLDNETVRELDGRIDKANIISTDKAKALFENSDFPAVYSNSENSINWVLKNLPESNLSCYIKLFKDKIAFRKMLKEIYPDFYYKESVLSEFKNLRLSDLKFPFVIKPAVGFLSLGVHTVYNINDWENVISIIEREMETAEKLYPKEVINSSDFILEEYIPGEEYAVDAYYDANGEPVILNIFKHPFLDSKDVRDRIYVMSADIMRKYFARFETLLKQIGNKNNIRKFPIHIEIRVTNKDKIIPIEINPMRFAGWCTTDVSRYAWGINVYECFMNSLKPDWDKILSSSNRKIYYFSMAEIDSGIDRANIKSFDYNGYLSNFSGISELRKIDFANNPLFAVVFGIAENISEVNNILKLKTKDYTTLS